MSNLIVTCGLTIQYNFGCSSILNGFYELLKSVYGENFRMVNIQIGEKPKAELLEDFAFENYFLPKCRTLNKVKQVFVEDKTRKEGYITYSEAFRIIKQADFLFDLYGICFCGRASNSFQAEIPVSIHAILTHDLQSFARFKHVTTIKNTASFGPFGTKYNAKLARFCKRHIYNWMIAREFESYKLIREIDNEKNLLLAPDTANIMTIRCPIAYKVKTIGISVSYQIVRQWGSSEDYCTCIANLCNYICEKHSMDVILIPNECNPDSLYNDVDVANEIYELINYKRKVSVLDVLNMSSKKIKEYIGGCEVFIASRYHSCVAALSCRVPLLVVGWHHKYEELMKLYCQEKWLISERECSSEVLIQMFNKLWNERESVKYELAHRHSVVEQSVLDVGASILKRGYK